MQSRQALGHGRVREPGRTAGPTGGIGVVRGECGDMRVGRDGVLRGVGGWRGDMRGGDRDAEHRVLLRG